MKIKDQKIIVNKAQCNKCKDIIESTHTHDFKWCSCHNLAVDGGPSYLKRCGDINNFTELSEMRDYIREVTPGMEDMYKRMAEDGQIEIVEA